MNVAFFGSFSDQPLPANWRRETAVALLGGGEFDLAQAEPGPDARLRAIAVFGSIKIRVPPGSRISMGGTSIFGSRKVQVTQRDGPALHVGGLALFGSVNVEEALAP